jgi:hypothetical protein
MAMHRHTSRPWLLIVVLIFGAAAAMATVPLQVAALKQGGIASAGDVARNGEVLERLERIEAESARNVDDHRVANDEAHAELCRIVEDIARAAEIDVPPCDFQRLHHDD